MSIREQSKKKPWLNWVLFLATVVIVFIIGLFAASILERRSEAQLYFQMINPIDEWETNNAAWGDNFPRQFQSYVKTADTTFSSKNGGSAKIDYLENYPELVVMWAGYAFSREYNQGRGHYHAVTDVQNILRTGIPQPATCWTCKSPDVPRMMNELGVAGFYAQTWEEMGPNIQNHIGCLDCHDPATMNLRISRPALIEAFERQGIDISKATRQEMRSLVCAQCHVEYYFGKEGNYLTFPWDEGFAAEDMETYLDNIGHVDFTHALSKTPMLKAQHPDYELYMTGIHAQRGVACADCHMPYKREGGIKFTDHHIQSPLNNISGSCVVCHRENEDELLKNVYDHQDRISELRRIAEKNLATVHIEAKFAWDAGATETDMKEVLQLIRHAQWRWDWVAAANGKGIHSPAEALRVLGTSIQKVNEARIILATIFIKYGHEYPIQLPDISTKENAQRFIGLDPEKMRRDKDEWKARVLPQWLSAL
ncbi:MAG: ammonia-forming cytochrome c nitrite reductase subunit c552 [Bacteroidales bacterium]|jgi:nitrite reductase (cytochrome c-552)|nr:ammonia-forming cytochrome c nitrite reductase subunit c552 [Bacteroidales bacterium]NLM91822.1 ammonia-forming cytochrome c nitrite reductase subunit c552 [Bacteroidales bacterium]